MQDSKTNTESSWNGGQIVAWVVLLFVLLFLCVLPFILGGVSLQGLGKLSPSSPLFTLCVAGMTLTGFAPMMSALLVVGFFPGTGGVRPFLRQIRTWRGGMSWYALALFGPLVLRVLDGRVDMIIGC